MDQGPALVLIGITVVGLLVALGFLVGMTMTFEAVCSQPGIENLAGCQ